MRRAVTHVWRRSAWDVLFARAYDRTASTLMDKPYAGLTRMLRTELGLGLADLAQGSMVLDAGCGSGHVTVRLARDCPHATVVGLDFSTTMLGLAADTLATAGSRNSRLVQGDSHQLPFRDARFDFVMSTGAVKNWADPATCLEEMYRVAKPGALVLLAEVNRDATRAEMDTWKRYLERALPGRPLRRRLRTWLFEHFVVRTSLGPADLAAIARSTSFRELRLTTLPDHPLMVAWVRKVAG